MPAVNAYRSAATPAGAPQDASRQQARAAEPHRQPGPAQDRRVRQQAAAQAQREERARDRQQAADSRAREARQERQQVESRRDQRLEQDVRRGRGEVVDTVA